MNELDCRQLVEDNTASSINSVQCDEITDKLSNFSTELLSPIPLEDTFINISMDQSVPTIQVNISNITTSAEDIN